MEHNQLFMKMITYYAHDPARIQHFLKVHAFAKIIGEAERLDAHTQFILETAAIVHDIGIKPAEEAYGRCDGPLQEKLGPDAACNMLAELGYAQDVIERVAYLVGRHHTYSHIDGMDYQILVEADFLVNLYEDAQSPQAIRQAYEKIFRTDAGKKICADMYL